MRYQRVLAAAAVLLLACSGEKNTARPGAEQREVVAESTARAATSPVVPGAPKSEANVNPTPTDTADRSWSAGVLEKKREAARVSTLIDVRAARHPDFDRIVFTFDDAGIPSYHIEYIDRPVRACGSGDVVPLPGDAWLAIRLQPANAHDEQGRSTIPARKLVAQLPNLLELRAICDFEADVEWVAAVRTPGHYRVLELKGPPRLVVDIRHR